MTRAALRYDESWRKWEQGNALFSPVIRHRRRMVLRVLGAVLPQPSILEVGCGDGALIRLLAQNGQGTFVGADISSYIIERNSRSGGRIRWAVLDLVASPLPQTFDLVICSEVLEHIEDHGTALRNVLQMSARYVLITVPRGRQLATDLKLGHLRHYEPSALAAMLAEHSFDIVTMFSFGFPFHSIYKRIINLRPEAFYRSFAESSYGIGKRAVAGALNGLFYLNSNRRGSQLLVLAHRRRVVG